MKHSYSITKTETYDNIKMGDKKLTLKTKDLTNGIRNWKIIVKTGRDQNKNDKSASAAHNHTNKTL